MAKKKMNEATKPQAYNLVGYARCSTADQNLDMQMDALKNAGCARVFTDQLSGKDTNRPGLAQAIEYMRPGDTLVVYKFDRLSRSTKDMLVLADELKTRQINLKSICDNIDTSTEQGRCFFAICAAFGQLEREMIVSRTKAGLTAARERGRIGGRPDVIGRDKVELAGRLLREGKAPRAVASLVGCSKATLYRQLAKHSVPYS